MSGRTQKAISPDEGKMILAIDVDYRGDTAMAAGVLFYHWEDTRPAAEYTTRIDAITPYEPGSFYKRELPCIQALLDEHGLNPDIIVVDGYVHLNETGRAGLGKHLFESLKGKTAVVGVAKNPFRGINPRYALYRGKSKKPLYVTAEGVSFSEARAAVSSMSGTYRLPDLLKRVDQLCRSQDRESSTS